MAPNALHVVLQALFPGAVTGTPFLGSPFCRATPASGIVSAVVQPILQRKDIAAFGRWFQHAILVVMGHGVSETCRSCGVNLVREPSLFLPPQPVLVAARGPRHASMKLSLHRLRFRSRTFRLRGVVVLVENLPRVLSRTRPRCYAPVVGLLREYISYLI